MATPTTQWVPIAILILLTSPLARSFTVTPPKVDLDHVVKPLKQADLDHVVKPPKAAPSRKLQMDNSGEDESSPMDGTGAPVSGCGGGQTRADREERGGGEGEGYFGGGNGSGGASFGFHNIHPFPAFPFGVVVPEVSTWGGGGGYGGSNSKSNSNSGKGIVQCHCSNGFVMHYGIHNPSMDVTAPNDNPPTSSP